VTIYGRYGKIWKKIDDDAPEAQYTFLQGRCHWSHANFFKYSRLLMLWGTFDKTFVAH
jgi:hypothetical protein